jgi:hypothetical protein
VIEISLFFQSHETGRVALALAAAREVRAEFWHATRTLFRES